jgi:CHAD domain-containing protein
MDRWIEETCCGDTSLSMEELPHRDSQVSTNIKRARAADPNILNHPFIQFNALD